jgi:transcription initiation factor TFIID subunit 7
MYKVADISQMLIVEPGTVKVETAQAKARETAANFDVDDYVYPHGLTPPLRYVRKRRFRKRTNKRTIEAVERDVERLLEADAKATSITFEQVEATDDLSDESDDERGARPPAAEAGAAIGMEVDQDDADGVPDIMGQTAAADDGDEPVRELDDDLAAALAEVSQDEESSSSSSEGDSDIGGGVEDLWGSEDEEAGARTAEGATPADGLTPAARLSPSDVRALVASSIGVLTAGSRTRLRTKRTPATRPSPPPARPLPWPSPPSATARPSSKPNRERPPD